MFADPGGELAAEAAGQGGLVEDEGAGGFPDGSGDGGVVQRSEGAQVDDLGVDAHLLDGPQGPVDAHAVGDDAQVVARAGHGGLADLRLVVAGRDLAAQAAVQGFVLEEEHGVGVGQGRDEEALGVGRVAGVNDLEAGHGGEPGFHCLAVVGAGPDAAAYGQAHGHVGVLVPAVVLFGEVVHDLVEAAGDEVAELHLHHRFAAGDAQAQADADDGAFAERGVTDTVGAKLLHETVGDLEDTAVVGNVLPHQHEVIVGEHAFAEAIGYGVDEAHFLRFFGRGRRCGGGWRGKHFPQFPLDIAGSLRHRPGGFQAGLNLFFDGFLHGLPFLRRKPALPDKVIGEVVDGVALPPGFDLFLGDVFHAAGFLVAAHPVGEAFEEDGFGVLAHFRDELRNRLIDLQDVVAVDGK